MNNRSLTRRSFAVGLAALPFLARVGQAQNPLPRIVVNQDPSCPCCGGWVGYLRAVGFSVDVVNTSEIFRLKTQLGVPDDLASCHTAEIGGYVVEGHVPERAIRRLLAEAPPATGIAVPGMPAGSPGMRAAGAPDVYDVILFGPAGRRRYARFQGLREIAG